MTPRHRVSARRGVAGETHVASGAGKGDAATGESLTVLTGVGMDFIERWAAMAEGGPTEQRLILVRDGRVESAIELPEPDAGTVPWTLALLGSDDGFIAFAGAEIRIDKKSAEFQAAYGVCDEALALDVVEPAAE